MNYCTGCGHKLESGAKFCTGCGKQLVVAKQRKRTNPFEALFVIGFVTMLFILLPPVIRSQDANVPISPADVGALTHTVMFTGVPLVITLWLLWCVGYYVWRRTS